MGQKFDKAFVAISCGPNHHLDVDKTLQITRDNRPQFFDDYVEVKMMEHQDRIVVSLRTADHKTVFTVRLWITGDATDFTFTNAPGIGAHGIHRHYRIGVAATGPEAVRLPKERIGQEYE